MLLATMDEKSGRVSTLRRAGKFREQRQRGEKASSEGGKDCRACGSKASVEMGAIMTIGSSGVDIFDRSVVNISGVVGMSCKLSTVFEYLLSVFAFTLS